MSHLSNGSLADTSDMERRQIFYPLLNCMCDKRSQCHTLLKCANEEFMKLWTEIAHNLLEGNVHLDNDMLDNLLNNYAKELEYLGDKGNSLRSKKVLLQKILQQKGGHRFFRDTLSPTLRTIALDISNPWELKK